MKQDKWTKEVKKRNKFLKKETGNCWEDVFVCSIGCEVFHPFDGQVISYYEGCKLGSYDYVEGDSLTITTKNNTINFFDIKFLKPNDFLSDFDKEINGEYLKHYTKESFKESFKDNSIASDLCSFYNSIKRQDTIIKYRWSGGHLAGRGWYILIRKFHGRYELVNKFRYYVS